MPKYIIIFLLISTHIFAKAINYEMIDDIHIKEVVVILTQDIENYTYLKTKYYIKNLYTDNDYIHIFTVQLKNGNIFQFYTFDSTPQWLEDYWDDIKDDGKIKIIKFDDFNYFSLRKIEGRSFPISEFFAFPASKYLNQSRRN